MLIEGFVFPNIRLNYQHFLTFYFQCIQLYTPNFSVHSKKLIQRNDGFAHLHACINLINWPTARVNHLPSSLVQMEAKFRVAWNKKEVFSQFLQWIGFLGQCQISVLFVFFITLIHITGMSVTAIKFYIVYVPWSKKSSIIL